MAIFFVSSKREYQTSIIQNPLSYLRSLVYFASFLATLNCRDVLRAKASQPVTLMLPINTTLTAVGYGGVMPGMLSRRCEDSLTMTPRLGSTRSSPRLRRFYTVEGGSPRLLDERTLRRMGSSRSVVRLHECAFIGKGDENLKVSKRVSFRPITSTRVRGRNRPHVRRLHSRPSIVSGPRTRRHYVASRLQPSRLRSREKNHKPDVNANSVRPLFLFLDTPPGTTQRRADAAAGRP